MIAEIYLPSFPGPWFTGTNVVTIVFILILMMIILMMIIVIVRAGLFIIAESSWGANTFPKAPIIRRHDHLIANEKCVEPEVEHFLL